MRTRPLHPNHCGFSLVELLTVIAVIGVLAAIIIPVVGRVRESARATECASNLRQYGIAAQTYAADNQGNFPWRYVTGYTGDDKRNGFDFVLPYLGDKQKLEIKMGCPTRRAQNKDNDTFAGWGIWQHPDPAHPTRARGTGNYSQASGTIAPSGSATRVRTNEAGANWLHLLDFDGWSAAASSPKASLDHMRRHGGKANHLFYDGRVARLSPAEIQRIFPAYAPAQ